MSSRLQVPSALGASSAGGTPQGSMTPAVVPSVASCDQMHIADELARIGDAYPNLHVDIEDGNFVPNITFGLKTVRALRQVTDKPFSVHLMVTDPMEYIDELCSLGCSHLFVHVESGQYVRRWLNRIREHGVRPGIALNPVSDVRKYEYLLSDCDAILYMTSEPDGAGELFQESVAKKIQSFPGIETWVDGGVRLKMLPHLSELGADVVVMGREIFGSQSPSELLSEVNALLG